MAEGRVIKIEFVLQPEEFAKGSQTTLGSLPLWVRWIGWVECGLLIALALIIYVSLERESPLPLIGLTIFVLVILAGVLFRRTVARYQFARLADKNEWFEFSESGFSCGIPGTESRHEWPTVTRYKETDTLFVIMQGVHFYTIPKRALSDEQVVQLRELLGDKGARSVAPS